MLIYVNTRYLKIENSLKHIWVFCNMNTFDELPKEVQVKIYDYDPTYRSHFKSCMMDIVHASQDFDVMSYFTKVQYMYHIDIPWTYVNFAEFMLKRCKQKKVLDLRDKN